MLTETCQFIWVATRCMWLGISSVIQSCTWTLLSKLPLMAFSSNKDFTFMTFVSSASLFLFARRVYLCVFHTIEFSLRETGREKKRREQMGFSGKVEYFISSRALSAEAMMYKLTRTIH